MLTEHLDLALARSRRAGTHVAVLFVDLDDFKLVNDDFGHAAGDELLRAVAARLCETVRETDTVARQGGDEFLILLPDIEPAEGATAVDHAIALAERVRSALTPPVVVAGVDVYASASIGIATFPGDADTAGDLLSAPTSRCTARRSAAATGMPSPAAPPRRRRSCASPRRAACVARWTATSSSCTTSRSCAWWTARCSASRP